MRVWEMKRAAKKPGEQPSLIDKLGDAFVKAFEADFQVHGVEVIEQLRQKAPEKYAEIATKLIAAAEKPASPRHGGIITPQPTWDTSKWSTSIKGGYHASRCL
jgi:hypothetical protein